MPDAQTVMLRVFDILGREVAILQNGMMKAGHHEVTFNAADLASGIYFYALESKNFSQVKKIALVK